MNHITTVEAAEALFATVRGVFKPRAGFADIHAGDVIARKAVCGLTHLLDEKEKIEAANGYLEMAAFFLKKHENKQFCALLVEVEDGTPGGSGIGQYEGMTVKAGRDRIMKVVRELRKRSVTTA
jgi:hypothetical protein